MAKKTRAVYQAPAMQVVWLEPEVPIANSGGDEIEIPEEAKQRRSIFGEEESSTRSSIWE